jgi:hypothetical protein
MDLPDSSLIAGLLQRREAGEEECLNELLPLEPERRRIAHRLSKNQ